MKKYAASIMLILGIAAFSKNDDGIFALNDEQKKALETAGFKESFVAKFNEALGKNFEEGSKTETSDETLSGLSVVDVQTLQETTVALANAEQQLEEANANATTLSTEKQALEQKVQTLQSEVQTLSLKPEDDKGSGTQQSKASMSGVKLNLMDDKQLGGFQGEMWSLERPYNQRARAAMLAKEGKQLGMVPVQNAVDFTALEADLGAFYRQNRSQQLLTFVKKTADISTIFPLESGVQDREVITNLFLGEFSQADNSDSDFEKVVKGKYEIQPEEIRMYDVMSSPKFSKLKQLEKQWIGYLNTEGSSSFKMSFIEYLLARTTEQLFNEQQRRRIRGVRKNPIVDVPGLAMEASTGLYRYIGEKINNLQIKPFELGTITSANIGEKVYQGTKMIPQDVLDRGDIVLYMPQEMVTEYHKYNETHYGTNQDYKADIMFVKEYPNVEIIPVPHAHNHRRLVWSPKGNIKTFENVPGEMIQFRVVVDMWNVKVTSQWKEGFAGIMVGKKWDRAQDMDYDHQMIFATSTDLAADSFLTMEKDTVTPSALFHNSLVSVANTELKTITNITDVPVGGQVTLKNGNDTYGIKLAVSGNFSLLASAWEPSVGDTITLVKRADGKFIELSRSAASTTILAFDADDATPSVADGTEFQTNENTEATAITTFDDAVVGKTYIIYGAGTTNASTIANSGNFTLTAAMTLSVGKSITLICTSAGKFAEISRV